MRTVDGVLDVVVVVVVRTVDCLVVDVTVLGFFTGLLAVVLPVGVYGFVVLGVPAVVRPTLREFLRGSKGEPEVRGP